MENKSNVPWQGRRPRVVLLGSSYQRPAVGGGVDALRPVISSLADVVTEDGEFSLDLAAIDFDLAIVFGGDGSILRAARLMGQQQRPVIGVKFGRLGFLADFLPADLSSALQQVAAGQCSIVDHLMLRCQIIRDGKEISDELGLNEVAIMGGPPFSMQQIELFVDGEFATLYNCDGLIVSTPVGSTAHNLSAGGPILRKDLRVFVISPLSPHTLTVRPVVDSADRVYELVVSLGEQSSYALIDGQSAHQLADQDRVRVTQAQPIFRLVQVPGQSYYRTLREKLGWSGGLRMGQSRQSGGA